MILFHVVKAIVLLACIMFGAWVVGSSISALSHLGSYSQHCVTHNIDTSTTHITDIKCDP